MYVQLRREEHRLLKELVEARIRDLHPEIRRSRDYRFKDEFKRQLKTLERLLGQLVEGECDVTA